jgi:hypothetical protein
MEDGSYWLAATRSYLPPALERSVTFCLSPLAEAQDRGMTVVTYRDTPPGTPNFVYIDGPAGNTPGKRVNGHGLALMANAPLDYYCLFDGNATTFRWTRENAQFSCRSGENLIHHYRWIERVSPS